MMTIEHALPEEWIKLLHEVMESNVSKEDFKIFLEEKKNNRDK